MPLEGKYLKFNSNITFEIFEKIYNKLNKEKLYCKNSIKTEYSWFPKYGYITHEEPQEQKNFATHTCIYGLEETTVQEILGYDPFVKEVIKEVIPEYVEHYGIIHKVKEWSPHSYCKLENGKEPFKHLVKPSTKEAFDAQNQPKYTEVEPGVFKPKQPLKQAVHCKTQEEWNFVLSKFNPRNLVKNKFLDYKGNSIIITVDFDSNVGRFGHLIHHKHQILSFQEWCDLNGYKMEKEVKFEVGKWYKYENWYIKYLKHDDGIWTASEYINDKKSYSNLRTSFGRSDSDSEKVLASIEEIQQYLPGNHPNKITPVIQQTRDMQSEFKVGDFVVNISGSKIIVLKDNTCAIVNERKDDFRHATPEEINNHLISIRQIPMDIQSGSTSENTYNHLISYGNKIHEEFFNPTVKFERNYDYTVNPKYKQEFNIINKTKTIKF